MRLEAVKSALYQIHTSSDLENMKIIIETDCRAVANLIQDFARHSTAG